MPSAGLTAPAVVYLLADHLDSALAAGEDLLKTNLSWNAGDARIADAVTEQRREERAALEATRSLEMVLLARVLKSRECAQELAKSDSFFRLIARLYTSGTEIVAEAASDLANEAEAAFDVGDSVTGFLRSRGLIAADAAAPLDAADLKITEEYRVAGRMTLGALLDLVAMFLDTLETHYDLYDEPQRGEVLSSAAATTGALI